MVCRKIVPLLPGLAEGSLSPAEVARCQLHLAACPACRALAADLGRLPEALAAWESPEVELPSGEAAAAWVLERSAAARRPAWPFLRPVQAGALAAAIVAAVFAGWWATTVGRNPARVREVRTPLPAQDEAKTAPAGPLMAGKPRVGIPDTGPRELEFAHSRDRVRERVRRPGSGSQQGRRLLVEQPGGAHVIHVHPRLRREPPPILKLPAALPVLIEDDFEMGRVVAVGLPVESVLMQEGQTGPGGLQ